MDSSILLDKLIGLLIQDWDCSFNRYKHFQAKMIPISFSISDRKSQQSSWFEGYDTLEPSKNDDIFKWRHTNICK